MTECIIGIGAIIALCVCENVDWSSIFFLIANVQIEIDLLDTTRVSC